MSKPIISVHTGGFTATNGYCFPAREGLVVIDAPEGMTEFLLASGQRPAVLFLTHSHFDHVVEAGRLVEEFGCPVAAWAPSTAADRLEHLLAMYLGREMCVAPYPVDLPLAGLDSVTLAGTDFLLRHVPGHSADSLVLIAEEARVIFSGDTVMDGGIGRTDFPDGDFDLLVAGIREKVLVFPRDFRVFPGHGGVSTVAEELRSNAYLC